MSDLPYDRERAISLLHTAVFLREKIAEIYEDGDVAAYLDHERKKERKKKNADTLKKHKENIKRKENHMCFFGSVR